MPDAGIDSVPRLGGGQTLIQITIPEETTEAEAAWCSEQLLTEDERRRAGRFLDSRDRHDYLIARSLVRLGLSRLVPVRPCDWRFGRDERGRPIIDSPKSMSGLQFSLTHTRGLVALLATLASQAGVDAERMDQIGDLDRVASTVFSPGEMGQLSRLGGQARMTRFFELWTLKESYAKARGFGLALPFRHLAFEFDETGRPVARFAAEVEDRPAEWRFWIQRVNPAHVLAVAVRKEPDEPCEIAVQPVRIRASQGAAWVEG